MRTHPEAVCKRKTRYPWGHVPICRIQTNIYMGGVLSWQFTILANNQVFFSNPTIAFQITKVFLQTSKYFFQKSKYCFAKIVNCQDSTPPIWNMLVRLLTSAPTASANLPPRVRELPCAWAETVLLLGTFRHASAKLPRLFPRGRRWQRLLKSSTGGYSNTHMGGLLSWQFTILSTQYLDFWKHTWTFNKYLDCFGTILGFWKKLELCQDSKLPR